MFKAQAQKHRAVSNDTVLNTQSPESFSLVIFFKVHIMNKLISKTSFTDRVTLALISIMGISFIFSPAGGAILLGSTIGICLDPFIFIPALIIGPFLNGRKKEKMAAIFSIVLIACLSAIITANYADEFVLILFLKMYALAFLSCSVSYAFSLIRKK
ncbi:MAG: hypothetical protein MRY79_03840 [Alphaproteobacteria bacterium]|nr:hypothetical protein [Alphaproteobacteria bacterium]